MAGLNDNVASRILEMFPGPKTLFAMKTIASRIDSRLYVQRQFSNQRRFNNENQRSNKAHPQKRNEPKFSFHKPLSKTRKGKKKKGKSLCLLWLSRPQFKRLYKEE